MSKSDRCRWVIALPAKNESERLEGALAALDVAAARTSFDIGVLVFANDCTDDTVAVAARSAGSAKRIEIAVEQALLPAAMAHAGGARSIAVGRALERFYANADDLLFTTDADARVHADALGKMEFAFERGAQVVLAKISCIRDPFEPACEKAVALGMLRASWRHRVRQFVELVRTGAVPDPPLHDDYGGAGIAATVSTYRRLGGFACVASEEDLGFVRAADRAQDVRVDRQSGAEVDVFTRLTGRAEGGMASELGRCTAAVARGLACLVENHRLTARRILRNPTHAAAFTDHITEWESAEDAIRGLDEVIAHFSRGNLPLASG